MSRSMRRRRDHLDGYEVVIPHRGSRCVARIESRTRRTTSPLLKTQVIRVNFFRVDRAIELPGHHRDASARWPVKLGELALESTERVVADIAGVATPITRLARAPTVLVHRLGGAVGVTDDEVTAVVYRSWVRHQQV